ncbi:MAG TPA: tocopherol cyclase family protein [Actinomycetota bacterium]|nr:tocopherol cyclase family protein [Actinomycetota bacterium]
MGPFTASGDENRMRWDGLTRGFMEVWYVTLHHRRTGVGAWFRYTLTAPKDSSLEPYCELWAFYFDPEGKRSFSGKKRFGIDRLAPRIGRDDGALIRIEDAFLSENHLEGQVTAGDRTLAWSLDFQPQQRCFQHLPAQIRDRVAGRASTLCSPNLSVPFYGTIELDGETLELEGDPGSQTHRWGRAHARAWAWAHCSAFDEGDSAIFEGLAAVPSLGSLPSPTVTFLYLEHEGQALGFNDLRQSLAARSRFELPTWAFTAKNDSWKIAGAVRVKLDRTVQVRYDDPDGTARYCANSELGDLAIEIYRRESAVWRHHASLTATGTAPAEFGRRDRFLDLEVAF